MSASLVVQTSFIGDVILTTPLIARLATQGAVDVVTTPAGAGVLANNPNVRELIVYDKRGADRRPAGLLRTVSRLRRAQARHGTPPRCAYLAQGSTRSALLALAAGYEQRIGFDTSSGSWWYTDKVHYHGDWHHARRLLSLANESQASAVDHAQLRPLLYPGDAERHAVDMLLARVTRPFIAIAPGSVWETKRWPYYPELARLLMDAFDVVIVGAPGDSALVNDVLREPWVIDATGALSLLGSAELLSRAAAIVTNDSAPQHLASGVGTPTVTVYGPTVPRFGFGPLAPESDVVEHPALACRPCNSHGPHRCPLGHWRCMRDISAGHVYESVLNVIHSGPQS